MGRRMLIIIIVVVAALAAWNLFPLILLFHQYYLEPIALYSPEKYRIIREDLINSVSRRGYRLCGEVTLSYGKISRAVFNGTFSGETMCLVFFNLPEPKGDYVIYQPAAVFTIMQPGGRTWIRSTRTASSSGSLESSHMRQ